MKLRIFHFLTFVLLFATGCAVYEPKPLDPDEEWRRLEAVSLEELARGPAGDGNAGAGPHTAFNYSDGLSIDEAAGLAVVLNPDLRAFRFEKGIAEGQLVGAGLLPNPERAH